MRKKNAFLIIDAQHDFCHPQGALYVSGAEQDMKKLAQVISKYASQIDHICLTLDWHSVHNISHPLFWKDKNGNPPAAFTNITKEQVLQGEWTPTRNYTEALAYLENLEKQAQFPHIIWTEHCLAGSKGASLDEQLMDALKIWTRNGRDYQCVRKGTHPLTEHFGIFMAQIPRADSPETQLNTQLIEQLQTYEKVYLAGEAKSHCVATSLKQAMDYAPQLAQKIVVIEDLMSDVSNLGHLGKPIYDQARQQGIAFVHSQDLILD